MRYIYGDSLGFPVIGQLSVTSVRTIIGQIGIGDPESPDFIVIHTDYLLQTDYVNNVSAGTAAIPEAPGLLLWGSLLSLVGLRMGLLRVWHRFSAARTP